MAHQDELPPAAPVPPKKLDTPHTVIDTDPHFFRVLRYARPSDYAAWAGVTAFFPAGQIAFKYLNWPGFSFRKHFHWRQNASMLRLNLAVGFLGGFLLLYQNSSARFWGWTENGREVQKDLQEMRQRVAEGKPLYGESSLTPYLQGVAARNSRYSQLKFAVFPMFNVVNHNEHGVDTSKYYETES